MVIHCRGPDELEKFIYLVYRSSSFVILKETEKKKTRSTRLTRERENNGSSRLS